MAGRNSDLARRLALERARRQGLSDTPGPGGGHVDEARDALINAANLVRALWISFVLFALYLTVAVGSVTHRHLFLQSPVKLPVLGVDLPLIAFFWVAPVLFVIFHGYVLLQLALMAEKARRLWDILHDRTDGLLRILPNHVFVQFLLRPVDKRHGAIGRMVRFVVWFTMVAAPLMVLVLFQLQFLPYHGLLTTWLHRAMIAADLALLWVFWASASRRPGAARSKWRSGGGWVFVSLLIGAFSVAVARFPGEAPRLMSDGNPLTSALFESEVNEVTGRRALLLSNTLVLPDADFVDDADYEKRPDEATVSLRGRDLRGAMLDRADLRKADFTGAMLNGASMMEARLEKASFGCARTGKAGTDLDGAEELSGPGNEDWPDDGCTWLRGAVLAGARLPGASLDFARLEGASLDFARLQGASLDRARLQGATLVNARLQGASLDSAELQGATLDFAQLQGASLFGAQLQGASLFGAQLQGAVLSTAAVHRTDISTVGFAGAWIERIDSRRHVFPDFRLGEEHYLPLVDDDVRRWQEQAMAYQGAEYRKEDTRERFARLSQDGMTAAEDGEIADAWARAEARSRVENQQVEPLATLACAAEGAPDVARGLIRHRFEYMPNASFLEIAARMQKGRQDPAACPGVRGLTDGDWGNLGTLVTLTKVITEENTPP